MYIEVLISVEPVKDMPLESGLSTKVLSIDDTGPAIRFNTQGDSPASSKDECLIIFPGRNGYGEIPGRDNFH